MTPRERLHARMNRNTQKIAELKSANEELAKADVLLCDSRQWFVEKMEMVTERDGNGKKIKVERLIGRVHWLEDFEDTGEGHVITIERKEVVRVDGKWDY